MKHRLFAALLICPSLYAQGTTTKGNILYSNPGLNHFHVIDISDPANPGNLLNVSFTGDFTHRTGGRAQSKRFAKH